MKWGLERALQLSSIPRDTEKKSGGRTGIDSKTAPLLLSSRRAHTSDWVLPHRHPDGSCLYGVIRCCTPANCPVGSCCSPERADKRRRKNPTLIRDRRGSGLKYVRQRSSISSKEDLYQLRVGSAWIGQEVMTPGRRHVDTNPGYVNKFTASWKSLRGVTERRGGVLDVLKRVYCFSPRKYRGVNGAKAGCDLVQTTPPFRTFPLLSAHTRRCVNC